MISNNLRVLWLEIWTRVNWVFCFQLLNKAEIGEDKSGSWGYSHLSVHLYFQVPLLVGVNILFLLAVDQGP